MSKAITFAEYGTPEVLRLSEVAPPEPGPGQVRIRVRAASVNPLDMKMRSGLMAGLMARQAAARKAESDKATSEKSATRQPARVVRVGSSVRTVPGGLPSLGKRR